ncbi:hypothetical protein CKALI_11350 [Corynebacterium kalinowskii]|uniref:Uncharacterized protein n=1 Tax=Corynebacterium kalinowskii TaxID=2675216 RepID=A0A6B8VNW4_9CORY|nr:hypothetical protein CKALI_11350 [Corynebacterium kalinowskii]
MEPPAKPQVTHPDRQVRFSKTPFDLQKPSNPYKMSGAIGLGLGFRSARVLPHPGSHFQTRMRFLWQATALISTPDPLDLLGLCLWCVAPGAKRLEVALIVSPAESNGRDVIDLEGTGLSSTPLTRVPVTPQNLESKPRRQIGALSVPLRAVGHDSAGSIGGTCPRSRYSRPSRLW